MTEENNRRRDEFWAAHAEKLKQELPHALTIRFADERMRKLFASVLCNSCEQHMYKQAKNEYGLRPDFVYFDAQREWLGDGTIRVFNCGAKDAKDGEDGKESEE